ncbi:MAG TPA: hypothetical protein VFR02_03940 [bacterium]|nr:hypothetical protein [bacterium]
MENEGYVPGVCNIGPQERVLRRAVGFLCVGFFTVLLLAFHFTHAPYSLRLVLLLPAFIGSVGFIQDSMRFCVNFGFRGLYNLTRSAGVTMGVAQAEFRSQDREKAVEILCYSLAAALVATYLALLV